MSTCCFADLYLIAKNEYTRSSGFFFLSYVVSAKDWKHDIHSIV